MTDLKELIEQEVAGFLDWPGDNKNIVTTASAMLFAEHVATLYADHIPGVRKMVSDQLRGGTKKIGRPQIREVFLRNGFTIKPDCDDLPDYVYESVFEPLELTAPAVQGEPVAWLAECMRSDFKKPLQALHLSPVLADDTCRHWKSRGCDVSLLPLYTTPQPAEQQISRSADQQISRSAAQVYDLQ